MKTSLRRWGAEVLRGKTFSLSVLSLGSARGRRRGLNKERGEREQGQHTKEVLERGHS